MVLSAGYIGLDFREDVPDLLTVAQDALPAKQRHYAAFATEMAIGDRVLLFAHHFPLALVRVAGEYNYIRTRSPELGVWFRHFRAVDDVKYYADRIVDVHAWPKITMTGTIAPLRDKKSASSQLIREWLEDS